MSTATEIHADQNWQQSSKISALGYLKELCLKALTRALVGRQGEAPSATPSEVPSDSPHRTP